MKKLIYSLILGILSQSAHCQFTLQNVNGRPKVQSLNGDWKYIVDPYQTGYYGFTGDVRPYGYYENKKVKDDYELLEYSFATSEVLQVPGDWNTQVEALYYYEGAVWYQRNFNVNNYDSLLNYVLHFGAVNDKAIVFVNGKRIGSHEGGFTSFNFEIGDFLKDGINDLVVLVDDTRSEEGVPSKVTDWFNYGGITREVSLVTLQKDFIQNYKVSYSDGYIDGYVQLNNSEFDGTIQLNIPELKIEKKLNVVYGMASFKLKASPQLWSTTSPKLYDVSLSLKKDQKISDKIGFRTVEVRGTEVLINGEPTFFKGISMHEEFPGGGRAFSRAHAEYMLGQAKKMNANFVRLAHYPHNEHMLRVADSLGIMIWSEIPVYWGIKWERPHVLAKAKSMLSEMILRDQNRASIVLWSMANETQPIPDRNIFLSALIKETRKLDPTRLITAATETHVDEANPAIFWLEDPINEQLDVMANNIYCGWYFDNPDGGCPAMQIKSRFNKPLIMSEFGAGAKAGYHGSDSVRWTEEFQDRVMKQDFKMLDQIPFLSGTAPWLLFDFRSPRRVLPKIQDGYNRKGLISEEGELKKAFHTVKEEYKIKGE